MGSTLWKELNFMQSYGLGGRSGLVVRTSGLHARYAGEGNSNACTLHGHQEIQMNASLEAAANWSGSGAPSAWCAAMGSSFWKELNFNHAASEAAAGLSFELPD